MQSFRIGVVVSILLITILLSACAKTAHNPKPLPRASLAEVQTSYGQGNYQQTLENLSLLAIEGDPEAQYALGYMYYYGQGTEQNIDLAKGWFQEALDGGLDKAQQALDAIEAAGVE